MQIWVETGHEYGISALVSYKHFAGKPPVASQNGGCFLSLTIVQLVPSYAIYLCMQSQELY